MKILLPLACCGLLIGCQNQPPRAAGTSPRPTSLELAESTFESGIYVGPTTITTRSYDGESHYEQTDSADHTLVIGEDGYPMTDQGTCWEVGDTTELDLGDAGSCFWTTTSLVVDSDRIHESGIVSCVLLGFPLTGVFDGTYEADPEGCITMDFTQDTITVDNGDTYLHVEATETGTLCP